MITSIITKEFVWLTAKRITALMRAAFILNRKKYKKTRKLLKNKNIYFMIK